jgi:hypothetical protein
VLVEQISQIKTVPVISHHRYLPRLYHEILCEEKANLLRKLCIACGCENEIFEWLCAIVGAALAVACGVVPFPERSFQTWSRALVRWNHTGYGPPPTQICEPAKPSTSKRGKMLAILSALILVLTYFVKDMLKERAKDVAASAESAETLYRTELGQSSLATQVMQMRQQITAIQQEAAPEGQDGQRDYKDVINADSALARQILGDLNITTDSVSRLIGKLPSDAEDLRQQLDALRPSIEQANWKVTETLKPSPKHDWTRAVEVKMAFISSAIAEVPVLVVGDAALTRVRQAKESADKLYRFSQWASYVLYTIGVSIGLYAALSGIKGLSGGE